MTISTKLKKVLFKLSNLYFPFNNLSPERLKEIVNHIRIIELQQDEILQMRGSRSQDYLYLMEGEIDIVCEGNIRTISDPVDTQRCPVLLPNEKNSCSIIAKSDCIISHANRDILDTIIAWDYIGRETRNAVKYIDMIRNTLVFQRLPIEYIENAFSRMKPSLFRKGETISADQSDAYYLILSGRAEVQKFDSADQNFKRVTELGIGDTFGDEAHVSGKNPDETVAILEDSEILILGKDDYQQLLSRPKVQTVQAQVAKTMLDNGYQLIDVRYPEEYAENRIPGSQAVPLSDLNQHLTKLNKQQPYILYCHSGPRSAIATLILHEHNFEALSLEGGIRDWPYEVEEASAKPNIVPLAKKFH
ncbi:MAG: rhodanese-like domain-containing protein [Gammaproteobacteria bacterium]|nr:rhodanese-like domain-containing protein [Gammaproteobacteria bacterium]